MTKVLLDTDTAALAGATAAANAAAASKATPENADSFPIVNSASSNAIGRVTFTNFKAFLKTYIDSMTSTFTNKRIQPRVSSSTSGNITPTKENFDRYIRTAQAAAITISNPTMDIGEVMAVQLTDDGTARDITFGTHYMALDGLALPTTTTVSKVMAMVLEKVTATKVLVSYVEEA